jgi:hypothetical protein
MKKWTTLTSLLLLGTTLSYIVTALMTTEEIKIDLAEEDIHLYL